MANTKLTALTELTSIASGDLLYIVDVSDTTEGAGGTSKKITRANTVTGLATSGANSDITSLTGLTTPLTVAQGGTGAATLTGILKGSGTSAFTAVTAPSGTIVGTSDTQTLTNKTIAYASNTLTGVAPVESPAFTGSGTIEVNFTSTTGFLQGGFALKVYDATNNGTGLMLGDAAGNFDTILYRSAANTFKTEDNLIVAGTVTSNTGNVVTVDGTQTLTNKRVNPRLQSDTTSATPTPTGDSTDQYSITALAEAATVAAPTGTPVNGQKLIIRIKDNGTARALSWNAIYRAMGTPLPTTTVLSKTLYLGFIYNSTDSKWDLVASAQEA